MKAGRASGYAEPRGSEWRGTLISGLSWSFVQIAAERLIQVGVFIITARLLGPLDFGVAAIAVVPALIGGYALQGLAQAVVQRAPMAPGLQAAFSVIALLASGLVALIIVAVAPVLAWSLGRADVASLTAWSALTPLAAGVGMVSEGLLTKAFAFRVLALRRPLGILVAGAVSIAMARSGQGAWALVAQTILLSAVPSLVCLSAMPICPRLSFSRADFRGALGAAVRLGANQLVEISGQRLPELVIGLAAGPAGAGQVRLAKAVFDLVSSLLFFPITTVLLPFFSRISASVQDLEASLARTAAGALVMLSVPALGIVALAEDIIVLMAGRAWADAADLLTIMGFMFPALSLQIPAGPYMIAAKRSGELVWCSLVQLALVCAFAGVCSLISTEAGVGGVVAGVWAGVVLLWRRLLRGSEVRMPVREVVTLVACIEVSLAALVIGERFYESSITTHAAAFLFSIVVYAAAVSLFCKELTRGALTYLRRSAP